MPQTGFYFVCSATDSTLFCFAEQKAAQEHQLCLALFSFLAASFAMLSSASVYYSSQTDASTTEALEQQKRSKYHLMI